MRGDIELMGDPPVPTLEKTLSGDVQYIEGCSVHRGDIMIHVGDTMSTSGGYHEYIRGYHEYMGDV